MADIVGGGTASLGGLSAPAAGSLTRITVTLVSPENGAVYPSTLMMVSLKRTASNGAAGDVQLQVSSNSGFTGTLIFDQVTTGVAGDGVTPSIINVSGLTDLSKYWWRARPVYPGTAQPPWSFSEVRSATINISSGNVLEYGNLNAGVMVTQESSALEYIEFNAGIEAILMSGNWIYVESNFGIEWTPTHTIGEYVHEGDVNDAIPDPHIWYLRPTAGRPYDGIDIVGFGFGALQETWHGVPQIALEPEAWEPLAVTDWQSFPPTEAAYTSGRTIDELENLIDPQHQIISIIIPGGAKPPGHPVRVRTEE